MGDCDDSCPVPLLCVGDGAAHVCHLYIHDIGKGGTSSLLVFRSMYAISNCEVTSSSLLRADNPQVSLCMWDSPHA